MEILSWTPLQTPSTSGKCNSLTTKPMMLKFGKNLLHFLNMNCFKFDINPTVDLGGKTIWNKTPKLCHGNLSMLNSCTHFFFEQHPSTHIRTNLLLTHSFSSFLLSSTQHTPLSLVSLLDLPWACSPWPFQASNSFPPINGLIILQEPMKIEDDLPSNWF